MSDALNNPHGAQGGTGSATIEQGGAGQKAAEDSKQSEGQSYLLDFPSREAAEKGYKETQGYATRLAQENAQLKQQLEAKALRSEIDSIKGALTSQSESEAQRKKQEEYNAYLADLMQRAEEEGASALVPAFSDGIARVRSEIDSKYQNEIKALREELAKAREEFGGSLQSTKLELSPEYQRLKPTMDELVAKGGVFADMSQSALMEIAKEVKGPELNNDFAPAPPGMGGSMGGQRVSEEPKGLTDDAKAQLMALGLLSRDQVENADKRLRGK